MKTKLLLPILIVSIVITSSFLFNKDNIKIINYFTNKEYLLKTDCNGEVYNTFPTLDSIKDIELKTFLKTLPHKSYTVKRDIPDWRFTNDIPSSLVNKLVCKNFDKILNLYIELKNCNYQIDNQKLTWKATALLPTNGKFIMLLLSFLYRDIDELNGSKYIVLTLDLNGYFINGYCIFDYTDYNYSHGYSDSLNAIDGIVKCLNTNQPIIRIAYSWNERKEYNEFNDRNFEKYSSTILINQIYYNINDTGKIEVMLQKDILPKKYFEWYGDSLIYYDLSSDTIQKILKTW